jgi:hypothetical protein
VSEQTAEEIQRAEDNLRAIAAANKAALDAENLRKEAARLQAEAEQAEANRFAAEMARRLGQG